MAQHTFVAFSSADPIVSDTVVEACKAAQSDGHEFTPWNRNDVSGQPIDRSVHGWVERADAFVADISEPNHNVTYEVGLALGARKPLRLIRAANKDRKVLEEIGLIHNIGHDDFNNRSQLIEILRRPYTTPPWPCPKRNHEQPIYLLQSSRIDDLLKRSMSGIKKILRMKFRSFNPREIDRLTASEAFEQVAQSFGVISGWQGPNDPDSFRQNQRAAFASGIARGLDIPFLLFAHASARLPLDLDELATRWSSFADIDAALRDFRETVADTQQAHVEVRPTTQARYLDIVHSGDPAAENEATQLNSYFLETEQYRLTLSGELNIILGRKGSGKTAIFLQVRDKIRSDKNNIVIDLAPESFELVKLKEFVLKQLTHGARKEFVAAFWEYILWLEIAYKLLEKDERRARYDAQMLKRYDRLEAAYKARADGSGDFAVRLSDLTDRILNRYHEALTTAGSEEGVSAKALQIVYGQEIRTIRDEVASYLKLKGVVCFLFDNLDRFWTPTGFGDLDALIIVALVECLQDMRKRFARMDIEFIWTIFIRSDVYEFVVRRMADYGKIAIASIEWNDRELLLKMFERRVLRGFGERPPEWNAVWSGVSVLTVSMQNTLDFLLDASLMRPRYLIRIFETARRRAVTLGRDVIDESDYQAALDELGWQVLEDFDRELSDVIPDAADLLFELAQLGTLTSLSDLRKVIAKKVDDAAVVDAIIDVLIWTGCLGVRTAERTYYISDCGFKRPFLRSLIVNEVERVVVFHPTLASIFAMPIAPSVRAPVGRRKVGDRRDERQGELLG